MKMSLVDLDYEILRENSKKPQSENTVVYQSRMKRNKDSGKNTLTSRSRYHPHTNGPVINMNQVRPHTANFISETKRGIRLGEDYAEHQPDNFKDRYLHRDMSQQKFHEQYDKERVWGSTDRIVKHLTTAMEI
jgi:hypothetical protein